MSELFLSLDIQSILLAIGIVMNAFLGLLIFIKRRGEQVNKIYLFNIICIIWWSVMIIIYRLADGDLLPWTIGLYVTPTFIASSFLVFSFYFPEEHAQIPIRPWYPLIITANILIVICTAVPGLIIEGAQRVPGSENVIYFGWLYPLYALYISGFFGLGLFILARKMILLNDPVKRRQLAYLLGGYLIASTFAMVTNLTLPYLGYFSFNWLGQVLTVFMVLPVTYAIFKHRLFDVKVIATELLVTTLGLFIFVRLLFDVTVRERITDAVLLMAFSIVGLILIRSVDREVEQRELIEVQEKELEAVNAQQQNLLHFISHEIKGYLAKSEAVFASVVEGDFGAVAPKLHEVAQAGLTDMRKGVATVMDILDASNLKKGTISFKKQELDFRALVMKIVEEQRPIAREKNLELEVHVADGAYRMRGDEEKLREHVIRNLIDNAIKYTPAGLVHVELSDGDGKIRFMVQDSGIGITPEDMTHLFTEGGHGKDSIKINVHSTGYGLFIAKQIVDAHGGKIWAETDGPGKGARFIVEFTA